MAFKVRETTPRQTPARMRSAVPMTDSVLVERAGGLFVGGGRFPMLDQDTGIQDQVVQLPTQHCLRPSPGEVTQSHTPPDRGRRYPQLDVGQTQAYLHGRLH
jgi:hypothetical protein